MPVTGASIEFDAHSCDVIVVMFPRSGSRAEMCQDDEYERGNPKNI